jgi:hypothetical protein
MTSFGFSYLLFYFLITNAALFPPQSVTPQSAEQPANCRHLAAGSAELPALAAICESLNALNRTLPNFVGQQVQTRVTRIAENVSERKVVSAILMYEDGREHYSNVQVDGKPTNEQAFSTAGGFVTFGDFASMLNGIFAESSRTEFLANRPDSSNPNLLSFAFHIRNQDNHWWALRDGAQQVFPELRGTLSIEPESFRVRSLHLEAVNIPSNFPSQNVTVTTEYDEFTIPNLGTFWLPVTSHWNSCLRVIEFSRRLHPTDWPARQTCIENSVTFENYRKFAAKSRVVPEPH